jgi:hypothetical protein
MGKLAEDMPSSLEEKVHTVLGYILESLATKNPLIQEQCAECVQVLVEKEFMKERVTLFENVLGQEIFFVSTKQKKESTNHFLYFFFLIVMETDKRRAISDIFFIVLMTNFEESTQGVTVFSPPTDRRFEQNSQTLASVVWGS